MDRRSFLATSAALALPAMSGVRPQPESRRLTRIGLELYAVRDAMKRDPDRTLGTIAEMGYTDVELLWSFDNFGRTTAQVIDALKANGLRAPSAHMSPMTILVGWGRALETAKRLGHEYLFVPSLPDEGKLTIDDWKEWADHFNRAGALARRAGIWLGFHNEPGHMKPGSGVVPYDVFVERTDPNLVRHQLDVGNMLMGGGDPHSYLTRYRQRYWSFHLKDVLPSRAGDTELGAGIFDFKRFLSAVPDLDRKICYVEQEGPKDSLASARANRLFLSGLRF